MSGPCVVLVVDDDAAIRAMVQDALELDGYQVVVAEDGAAGLAALEGLAPCLVLLDMRMPVLDGWAFCKQYRQRGQRAPVVVMTAADDAERWRAEIGGDGCLPKPFDLDALYVTVDRYCKSAA
jgi:two-component system chemotaxis response regulator CheY